MRTAKSLVLWLAIVTLVAGTFQLAMAADTPRVTPVLDRILAKKELVVGTAADMPPLNMTLKDGKIVGMEIDLARMMAEGMDVKLTLKPINFNDLIPALEAGQVDLVMSGMTITPTRNLKVAFAGPYFASGKSILTKEANAPSLQSVEQMNKPDVVLAALKGSTSQLFVERLLPNAKLVLTDDYDQAVAMVLDGRANAMVADYPICMVAVYRYRDKALTSLKNPLTYEPIGIVLPPTDPLLLNLVQNFLIRMVNSGELEVLRQRWFNDASWVNQLR
ncbi:MAG: transporter substrate-binding domain-containing protein [Candidatus Methylomirabilales bacterium]